jgi:hypothetical protein
MSLRNTIVETLRHEGETRAAGIVESLTPAKRARAELDLSAAAARARHYANAILAAASSRLPLPQAATAWNALRRTLAQAGDTPAVNLFKAEAARLVADIEAKARVVTAAAVALQAYGVQGRDAVRTTRGLAAGAASANGTAPLAWQQAARLVAMTAEAVADETVTAAAVAQAMAKIESGAAERVRSEAEAKRAEAEKAKRAAKRAAAAKAA